MASQEQLRPPASLHGETHKHSIHGHRGPRSVPARAYAFQALLFCFFLKAVFSAQILGSFSALIRFLFQAWGETSLSY